VRGEEGKEKERGGRGRDPAAFFNHFKHWLYVSRKVLKSWHFIVAQYGRSFNCLFFDC